MRAPVECVFRQNDPVRRLSLTTRLCEQPIDEERSRHPSSVLHSSSVALGVTPSGRSHFSRRENVPNDSYFPSCRDSLGRGSNLQGWRRERAPGAD